MPNEPQLRMRRDGLDGLPAPDPRVRPASAEDAPGIARVLTLAFGVEWDEAKVRAELLDHPGVPATFVAVVEGHVAATASYQLQPDFPDAGWVHWVGADPAFAGRGLGKAVTAAVLHAAQADGKAQAGLTTDDARLAAIRTYLALGFRPDPCDPSRPARWQAVLDGLHPGP